MQFEDFLQHFDEACICKVMNTSETSFAKTWQEAIVNGNFADKPQFRFDVKTSDMDKRKEVVVQLSQRDTRSIPDFDNDMIGFMILKVELNRKHRLQDFFNHDFVNFTEMRFRKHIFLRASLPNGRYVIVPTTWNSDENRDFLLRIYTEKKSNLTLLRGVTKLFSAMLT